MTSGIQQKQQFEEAGFIICRGFANGLVEEIADNLERLISRIVPGMPAEHVFYEDKSDVSTLKQLQLLHLHDEWFSSLADDSPFRRLAEELLGEPTTCRNLQYFNKPPQSGRATPPHQDGYYFKVTPPNALTMWLALDEVDAENGCVRYIPGSHREGMRPHGVTGTLGFSQGITDYPNSSDTQREVALPASPGDLLAHHAMTIHRADANLSADRSRRALGFIYYGQSAQENIEARRRYENQLKQQQSGLI